MKGQEHKMDLQENKKNKLNTSELATLHRKMNNWRGQKNKLMVSDLKPRVLDKKIKDPEQKLSRKELNLLVAYFEAVEKGITIDIPGMMPTDLKFEQILFDSSKTVNALIKEYDKQITPKSSLIPIKGISKILQAKLRELYIYDVSALLSRGRTQKDRDSLASKLKVDVNEVESWIKQADLWRVSGMTTDIAYLLVISGVRCVEDLARVDAKKIFPIIKGISAVQTDFQAPSSKEEIYQLIKNAQDLVIYSVRSENLRLRSLPDSLLNAINAIKNSGDPNNMDMQGVVEFIQSDMLSSLADSDGNNWYQELGEVPSHLFKDDKNISEIEFMTTGKVIKKGLDFLDDVQYSLPLPNTLSGTVYIRRKDSTEKRTFSGAEVEISGIVSPTEDLKDLNKKLCAITDSQGKFIIALPDKYSIKEIVTISISQGQKKQEFVKNVSEILDSVKERKKLDNFYQLDALGDEIDKLTLLIEQTEKEQQRLIEQAEGKQKKWNDKSYSQKLSSYRQKLDELSNNYDKAEAKLLQECDALTIKMAFDKFLASCKSLNANLEGTNNNAQEDEGFVIIEELFSGQRLDLETALPKVKLMGNDEHVIRLATDTAPSKTYRYSMLQRLVEPNISSPNGRKKLTAPVSVMNFKETLYTDPDRYPQATSLGIGYVLNMHQAWIPDGFSLGSLLYSLVLAPGEEQRLVVRENKQSYSITNDSEGSDIERESYEQGQFDDTLAAFNKAIDQMSNGYSDYNYSTSSGSFGSSLLGGIFGRGKGISLGLSGGYSRNRGHGSSSASQRNSHNEVSNAAQTFQRNIKSASNRISQAKRISVSMGTSETSDSVATKIIANHNHSHTMTVQYWEVMRRYKLESCIDSVDLVLFVPLQLIHFLPLGEKYQLMDVNSLVFNKTRFSQRYGVLLKYEQALRYALPYRYLRGLELIKKYAAYPHWSLENTNDGSRTLGLTFSGNFLTFDDLSVTLRLKNGRGTVAGEIVHYPRAKIQILDLYEGRKRNCSTRNEVRQAIRDERNKQGSVNVTVLFHLPSDFVNDDLDYICIKHSIDPLNYTLEHHGELTKAESKAYELYLARILDLAKDNDNSQHDRREIAHYKSSLPEAYITPQITLLPEHLRALGNPTIHSVSVNIDSASRIQATLSYSELNSSTYIKLSTEEKTLRYSEFQLMEETLQHIASETLRYSQAVWQSLSSDERTMLLEQYTIDMNFDELQDSEQSKKEKIDIPLLNCVNVKKLLGFYGNCMLLPFTYPQSLAKRLGKTAGEIQDALYRYHTNNFRVPTTIVSLPTDGMIGEAVLGETNVSEEIDLTRFWNWQDSPIDKMEIGSNYLNGTDYLAGKSPQGITPLGLQGATAPTSATVADVLSALINKQTPQFTDITALNQLKEVLNAGTESTKSGRDKVVESSTELVKSALNYASKANGLENKAPKEDKSSNACSYKVSGSISLGNNPLKEDKSSQEDNTSKGDKSSGKH